MKVLASLVSVCLVLAIVSCSGEPPSIQRLEWYFIQIPSPSGHPSERLSVFAAVSDKDGEDDIEALYVAQDDSELVWKFNPDTWTKKQQDSATWFGSNTISMVDASSLPRGTYRILVVDQAGESDERSFSLSEPPPLEATTFDFSLSGDIVSLKTPFSQSQVIFLDSSGVTLGSLPLTQGANSLRALLSAQSYESLARSVLALSIDAVARRGLMSPRFELK